MNKRYEALMLTVPEITQDEAKQLEKELDKMITSHKGSIISFERWGKYKLTYPIQRNHYGVYFLIRFESPEPITTQLNELFRIKLNNFVMRHVISALKGDSLEYQRPKSLEEVPASRDMDTFLKENKMEGLLSSVDKKKDAEKKAAPAPAADQSVEQETASADQ
jgi:small subunit ribosomal protein S6